MQLTLLSAVDPAVRMALIPVKGMVKIHHLSEKQWFLLSIDSNVFFLTQSLSTFTNIVNNKLFIFLIITLFTTNLDYNHDSSNENDCVDSKKSFEFLLGIKAFLICLFTNRYKLFTASRAFS